MNLVNGYKVAEDKGNRCVTRGVRRSRGESLGMTCHKISLFF